MPVPVAISTQLTAFGVLVTAAGNLDNAPFSTINALAYQAGLLGTAVEAAIPGAAGALDTFAAPLMPADIVVGVQAILDASGTQLALSDLEGFVGRIEINLENR